MRSCPSERDLSILAKDDLDTADFAEMEAHIKECPACQARLEPLAWEIPTPPATGPCLVPPTGEVPQIPGFAIEKELGRGSMGVVYLAWQETVGRRVAVKVMQAVPGADERARKRWRAEAKAFSSVRHPNVVGLYDIGEEHTWLYLVLEYIPGQTLKDRVVGQRHPREAAEFIVTIADAVHRVHQTGLLHLDLKPSNILLEGEPGVSLDRATPKVADFGIARFLADAELSGTSSTRGGTWDGTPSYMAPEQVPGMRDQLSPATDVHALGAILYRLVTGRPPYQGATPLDTINDVRTRQPVPPRSSHLRSPEMSRRLF